MAAAPFASPARRAPRMANRLSTQRSGSDRANGAPRSAKADGRCGARPAGAALVEIDAVAQQVKHSEGRAGVDLDARDIADAAPRQAPLGTHPVPPPCCDRSGTPSRLRCGESRGHVGRRVVAVAGRRMAVQVDPDRLTHKRRHPLARQWPDRIEPRPGHSTRMSHEVDNPVCKSILSACLDSHLRGIAARRRRCCEIA